MWVGNKPETKGQGNYESKQVVRTIIKPLISQARSSALLLEVWGQVIDSLTWPFQQRSRTQPFKKRPPLDNQADKQTVMSMMTSTRTLLCADKHISERPSVVNPVISILETLNVLLLNVRSPFYLPGVTGWTCNWSTGCTDTSLQGFCSQLPFPMLLFRKRRSIIST